MPHINIKLYPGKSEEMKESLAKAVRKAMVEESGVWKESDISVSMEEYGPDEFEKAAKASFKKEELMLDSDYVNFR